MRLAGSTPANWPRAGVEECMPPAGSAQQGVRPQNAVSEPRRPSAIIVGLWVMMAALLVVGGRLLAGRGAVDTSALEARLAVLEEKVTALADRPAAPRFLTDPGTPADRASVTDAVAALSEELAELRAQLAQAAGAPRSSRSAFDLAASADPEARRRSIRQLRELAATDPEARRLLSRLLADPDPRVRREALDAIARLGDPAALGEILALTGDGDPQVRARAARAVGDAAEEAKDPVARTKAAQALEGMLADERPNVRRQAVQALREMGGKETAPALARALSDPSFEVQEAAIEGLARVGDASAQPALRQIYGDGTGANALEAAVALKRLGDPVPFQREAERLRQVMRQGGSPDDKREALRILVDNSPAEAGALIQQALRDPSETVRREAQRLQERRRR